MNERLHSLSRAVAALYSYGNPNICEEANKFIQHWQQCQECIKDCIKIITMISDVHLQFVAIKTLQIKIRYSWLKISQEEIDHIMNALFFFLNQCALSHVQSSQLTQTNLNFTLICLSDISCQLGSLRDSLLSSIPRHLLPRFFTFFFENWHETFCVKTIQHNFISYGFEILSHYDISEEWLRILFSLSSEINEASLFIRFYPIILDMKNENVIYLKLVLAIFDSLCKQNYSSIDHFCAFLDFFINMSIKMSSIDLWISFFQLKNDYFLEKQVSVFIEKIIHEFFRIATMLNHRILCTTYANVNDNYDTDLSVANNIDLYDFISLSFDFFISTQSEILKSFHYLYLIFIKNIFSNRIDPDNIYNISHVLSNLHRLNSFNLFIQKEEKDLSLLTLISFNSNFVDSIFLENCTNLILNYQGEATPFVLIYIENTFAFHDITVLHQYLQIIHQLFPIYTVKCAQTLYKIVSKCFDNLNEDIYDAFHQYISYNHPLIIPILLYLLKKENFDLFAEITQKINEMMQSLPLLKFLSFIKIFLMRVPVNFPFLSNFIQDLSMTLFSVLAPISTSTHHFAVNMEILKIFSIIWENQFLITSSLFINWINSLLNIEDKITNYHLDFMQYFDICYFPQLKQYLTHFYDDSLLNSSLFLISHVLTTISITQNAWDYFPLKILLNGLGSADEVIVTKSQAIVSLNINSLERTSQFFQEIVMNFFVENNILQIVLLLASIAKKLSIDIFSQMLLDAFPSQTEKLYQFINLLSSSFNIPQMIDCANEIKKNTHFVIDAH